MGALCQDAPRKTGKKGGLAPGEVESLENLLSLLRMHWDHRPSLL